MINLNRFIFCVLILTVSSCSSFKSKLKEFKPTGVAEHRQALKAGWIKNLDPDYNSGNLPIGLQSPLIHDGIVYAGNNNGFMQAYEVGNGRLVWSGDDGSAFHAGAVSYNDQVIYGTVEGRVISRHAVLGTIKYSIDLGSSVETRGVVSNGKIFFQLRNHQVFSLDVETGKILWGYKRAVPYLTTLQRASRPIIYQDKLLVGFADGTLAAISVEEGVLLYDVKLSNAAKFMDVDNVPFILNDKLYIAPAAGNVSQLDPKTGRVLRTSLFSATREPIVQGENLLFGNADGEIIVSDKNLTELNRYQAVEGSITNIVEYKNHYAISTATKHIYLVTKDNFKMVERFDLGHAYSAVFGEMVSTGDELAVISSRNRLYLFK